jgi:WD40 repeat protein
VALKLLAPGLAENEAFRERFLAESKLAASLDHPGVVPIYEAGEADGRLFIAMRYVEGSDLKARLRDGPLSAERTVRLCAQVADALDFAHGRGLVHRDVKPSNVLLDGRDHAYLADFGLTKRLGEPHSVEPGVLGTIDYVAPEQIRGEKVNGRADEYSLGCLLYECLIGEPPFARSTHAAVLYAHLEEHPPAPMGLEVVMRTALAKEPEGRYPTCADLVVAASEALGVPEGGRSPGLPFLLAGVVCPFKGLSFFDRADAEYFCGRERVVSEVVAQLAASTLVGILGPSGIGKSSLLRAGVLPALSAGVLPRSAEWRQILFRPGDHPCGELVRALGGEGLDSALARLAPDERIVVAVDQLEELFTACQEEQERAAFLEELAAAALDRDRRALILCSLRADFYGRFVSYPGFAQLLNSSHTLMGPMDADELARAIEEPATRAGLEVERPLVEELVSDVAGEPGGLPLLSTMLLELWQTRDGRTLRYESYRTSGGVRAAVARLAEGAFVGLDESGRGVARNVMLRLVSGDDAAVVRRRVPISELGQIDGADLVLATLTDARLLTVADGEVELSHEALIEEWPRYRSWLEEDRVGRRVHTHVTTAAREWDARGRDPGDLYRGARLAAAQEWAAQHGDLINRLERDFLQASDREAQSEARRQRAQNRRLRWLAAGAGLLLALALVAVVFAEVQKGRANQQRRTAQSLQLAASAQAALGTDPELSTLLALQALRISGTNRAAQALRDALAQQRVLATLPAGGALSSATFSPDGREIITAGGADGTARIWSAGSHRQLSVIKANSFLYRALFSPDGTKIVTVGVDGPAEIWSARTHQKLGVLTGSVGLYSAAFSPDSKKIVTASQGDVRGHTTEIWSTRSYKKLGALTEPGADLVSGNDVYSAAFSPDGKEIVTASADGIARIWSASSHKQLGVLTEPGSGQLNSASFSPDGEEIITASNDGTARVWSAGSRKQLGVLTEPSDSPVNSAVFSPDGKEIVTASEDGTARIWSATSYQQLFVLAGHNGFVQSAVFSPDGKEVVTASRDGTAKLWTAAPLEQLGVLTEPGNGPLHSAVFSPNGREIVTASKDGAARTWSAGSYHEIRLLMEPTKGTNDYYGKDIVSAVFSPGGNEIVTASRDGTAWIWNASNRRQLGRLAPPLLSAAFSTNGREVITAGSDSTARIWDAGTRRQLGVLTDPGGNIFSSAEFSPDGREIVTAGKDGTARIWSDSSYRQLGVLTEPHHSELNSAAFSPDGKEIVTASNDGDARIWSMSSRQPLGVLTEPLNGRLNSASFSPDGKEIVTASEDGTARIWSASDYDQLTVLVGNSSMNFAAFSPNGTKIITAGEDGTARIWSTELAGSVQAIERIAETRVTRRLTPSERKTYLTTS